MPEDNSTENDRLEDALAAEQSGQTDASKAAPASATATKDDPKAVSTTKPAPKKAAKKKAAPTPARRNDTQGEAKQAQDKARKAVIAQAEKDQPPEIPISEAEQAELDRKADLQVKLAETAGLIEEHEDAVEKLKATARELMAKLYPHMEKSDRHVDAVRGYLKSSQEERKNRGAHPARLKELLAQAGKAPVDAAFQRARARGKGRPQRSPVNAGKAPAADQAQGATPGAKE